MTFRHLLFAVLLVAFAASGCIFSPDPDPDPPAPPVIECTTATSPDEAMAAFKTAYEGRSLDCYRELLSESYLFIPQDDQASYGYDIEIDIARKMFEGLEGENGFVIQDIDAFGGGGNANRRLRNRLVLRRPDGHLQFYEMFIVLTLGIHKVDLRNGADGIVVVIYHPLVQHGQIPHWSGRAGID